MPRFFCDPITGNTTTISGEDARHIAKVLRMVPGEALTLCDMSGWDYECAITQVEPALVTLQVMEKHPSLTEPSLKVRLYQAVSKGDKFEFIVQKAVELGVDEIIPVMTHRCVSRPDERSMEKKLIRYQRVAQEAAKQSMRGKIPKVRPLITYPQALAEMAQDPLAILFYERSENPLTQLLTHCPDRLSILVGAEGGFEEQEVQRAQAQGIAIATLGRRILRCETAPLAALSAAMYATGNMD